MLELKVLGCRAHLWQRLDFALFWSTLSCEWIFDSLGRIASHTQFVNSWNQVLHANTKVAFQVIDKNNVDYNSIACYHLINDFCLCYSKYFLIKGLFYCHDKIQGRIFRIKLREKFKWIITGTRIWPPLVTFLFLIIITLDYKFPTKKLTFFRKRIKKLAHDFCRIYFTGSKNLVATKYSRFSKHDSRISLWREWTLWKYCCPLGSFCSYQK